jgi:hypothetical protein
MSADNFWYVVGNKVICGFASDFEDSKYPEWLYRLKLRWHHCKLRPHHLYYSYVGKDREDAMEWALDNYAEYGVWW